LENALGEWTLIDCMPMVSEEENLPRCKVESEEHLRDQLNRYRKRSPASIIELVSPDGDILHMGVGTEFSGIRWIREPLNAARKRLKMAVADRSYCDAGMEFRFQGSESGFRAKYVIPVEKTINAAIHYFKTGQLPDWLQWAEWTDRCGNMKTDPDDGRE
jgi:hypothetical protein